jgi:predicted nucleic acid-binding protein
MAKTLVDSSVWIEFFRRSKSTPALAHLVRSNQAWVTDIIRVELLSGTRSEAEYRMLENRLTSIPILPEPDEFWNRVALARFKLARRGIQAAVTDVSIAVLASLHSCVLWTLDRQFNAIAKIPPLRLYSSKR